MCICDSPLTMPLLGQSGQPAWGPLPELLELVGSDGEDPPTARSGELPGAHVATVDPLVDRVDLASELAGEFALGRGRVLEPRLAFLFGLTDESPDAVASLNLEMKF